MKNKRMIIALKPRSMGKLAGWDLFLSEYLQQGLSGGGDFQITMDYKEGDGLTMQLVKGDKKLKETHIRREPLDIAAKVLHHAARFTLVAQRRNENPSILLAQDTGVWVSKDLSRLKRCHLTPNRRTEHRGKFGFTIGDE